MRLKIPGVSVPLMKWFQKRYKINMEEVEHPLSHYKCIGDLFVRDLKPGIRPISTEASVVHPADSEITSFGEIKQGQLFQAKGKTYQVTDFLGCSKGEAKKYEGGHFVTYYLCPTDYHQVHSPVTGELIKAHYLPGRLWPVNPWSVSHISQLFSVNERVAISIKNQNGEAAAVMVGATNVGRMTTSFEPEIITNNKHFRKSKEYNYQGKQISKGDKLGVFHMGSTVIMLFEKGYLKKPDLIQPGFVKMGGILD